MRLTARSPKNNLAYLINVKEDEQVVDGPYRNTLQCILDSFERLTQYEETELEPQEVKEQAAENEQLKSVTAEKFDVGLEKLMQKTNDIWKAEYTKVKLENEKLRAQVGACREALELIADCGEMPVHLEEKCLKALAADERYDEFHKDWKVLVTADSGSALLDAIRRLRQDNKELASAALEKPPYKADLKRENEQLRAQAAQYKDALETATETIENVYGHGTSETEGYRDILNFPDAGKNLLDELRQKDAALKQVKYYLTEFAELEDCCSEECTCETRDEVLQCAVNCSIAEIDKAIGGDTHD